MTRLSRSRQLAAVLVAALVAVACAGGPRSDDLGGITFDQPVPKPDFTLTDTDGEAFHFAADTDGDLTLLYFGYTMCPDICPVHLAQIAETFEEFPQIGSAAKVVFVTVDPDRDTPEVVRAFLDNFDRRFIGLTGTDEELEAAQIAAGVPVATKDGTGPNYTVGHAGQVLAYAPDGFMYSQYPFGTRQTTWLNDLSLLAEKTDDA